jgi:6-phosphogluconolactonase
MHIATHVFRNEQALFQACAARVVQLAADALDARNSFFLALSGGNTPAGLYSALASAEFASRLDWSRSHIYFGDERCVPADHRDSNYRMARERLLDQVPVPQSQVHRIAGEMAAEDAANAYAREVNDTVPTEHHLPRFDLILLGVGLDGHVASLFPNTDILHKRKTAASVYVEKLDACRVSLTLPVINNARHVMLLVAGAKKADVVRHVLRGAPGADPLPVQMLKPNGVLEWYLDADAARQLGREPEA